MALPAQHLFNDDLLIINRITKNDVETYKVSAEDIGIFLLQSPQAPGTNPGDYYVNDGPLNVYGYKTTDRDNVSIINLHSANEWCEGKLRFAKGFFISGIDMDVLIEPDYTDLTDNLACDLGGIDGDTDCLKLDMEWLSDNIICSNSGLGTYDNTGCIFIDTCDGSGLEVTPDGCIQVQLCDDGGVIHANDDGCIRVDMNYISTHISCEGLKLQYDDPSAECITIDLDWLSDNIVCHDQGLLSFGECIGIDPCWVGDQFNTTNPQYYVSDFEALSIDTDGCKFRVNMEWMASNIRCGPYDDPTAEGGSGLIDNGGCIAVDPCWVGDQFNCTNAQYDYDDHFAYQQHSIDTNGCHIRINMEWLAANIRCGDPGDPTAGGDPNNHNIGGSGLINEGECISVDPCWVGDQWNTENPHYDYDNHFAYQQQSIDTNGCHIRINMEWLAANIRCGDPDNPTAGGDPNNNNIGGSGLINEGECISVDPCWVGDQWNTENPHYDYDSDFAYDQNSIDTNGCHIRVNMEWLAANIRCGDPNDPTAENGSGLINNGECIRVDPCWVTDQLSSSNGSIDVGGCNVSVNVSWLCSQIGTVNVSGCLTGGGKPCTKDITIGLDESCLKIYWSQIQDPPPFCLPPCDGGGPGPAPGPPVDPGDVCFSSPIVLGDDGCYTIKGDPKVCMELGKITTERITNLTAGNPNKPGFLLGIKPGKGGKYNYIAIVGSEDDHRIRFCANNDWEQDDPCAESSGASNNDIAYFQADVDSKDNRPDSSPGYKNSLRVTKLPIPYVTTTGVPISHYSHPDSGETGAGADRTKGTIKGSFSPLALPTPVIDDPDNLIDEYYTHEETTEDPSNFNIDTILTDLAGTGTTTALAQGNIKFSRISEIFCRIFGGEDGANPQEMSPSLRADRVAQIHPALALYDWSEDSYVRYPLSDEIEEDDPKFWSGRYLKEPAERSKIATDVNEHALIVLLLAQARRQRARIETLESRPGMLNVLGIEEFNNETAAANSGLGQGEVYWDISLNRMRAVT